MKFTETAIIEIEQLTKDAVKIVFQAPNNFTFHAGQFITLSLDLAGENHRRDYSLCSSPLSHQMEIGVKKVTHGTVSKYLTQELKVGETLKVSEPHGRFGIPSKPNEKRTLVAFAAGSGITPILSILKFTLATEKDVTFHLFYSNQTMAQALFTKELQQLQTQYPDNLFIHWVLTQEKTENPLFHGRLDGNKLELLINQIIDWDEVDEVIICGPEEMTRSLANATHDFGIPKENIHFELFTPLKDEIFVSDQSKETTNVTAVEVEVELDGETHTMLWENNGKDLLDALLDEGLDAPYSCKGGVCSTCLCDILEGAVVHGENLVLTDDDLAQGKILPCSAFPKTKKIKIRFEE